MMRARLLLVAVLTASVAATASSSAKATPLGAKAQELLPDLVINAPGGVKTRTEQIDGTTRSFIAFTSIGANAGRGPLHVVARRPNRSTPTMRIDQLIFRADGTTSRRNRVGEFEFVTNLTHNHWHVLKFMTYRLRLVNSDAAGRRDRKNGFCLGDRRRHDGRILGTPPVDPVYMFNCGENNANLLRLVEGISVGWADNYGPFRDGQEIDVTGLPEGEYELIFRVNPSGALRERTLHNNASSSRVRLTWPNGTSEEPRVRVLKRCSRKPTCG